MGLCWRNDQLSLDEIGDGRDVRRIPVACAKFTGALAGSYVHKRDKCPYLFVCLRAIEPGHVGHLYPVFDELKIFGRVRFARGAKQVARLRVSSLGKLPIAPYLGSRGKSHSSPNRARPWQKSLPVNQGLQERYLRPCSAQPNVRSFDGSPNTSCANATLWPIHRRCRMHKGIRYHSQPSTSL